MTIEACRSYFSGFNEFSLNNSFKGNALAALKIASYFTIIIPLGMAIVYGGASLFGRGSHNTENLPGVNTAKQMGSTHLSTETPQERIVKLIEEAGKSWNYEKQTELYLAAAKIEIELNQFDKAEEILNTLYKVRELQKEGHNFSQHDLGNILELRLQINKHKKIDTPPIEVAALESSLEKSEAPFYLYYLNLAKYYSQNGDTAKTDFNLKKAIVSTDASYGYQMDVDSMLEIANTSVQLKRQDSVENALTLLFEMKNDKRFESQNIDWKNNFQFKLNKIQILRKFNDAEREIKNKQYYFAIDILKTIPYFINQNKDSDSMEKFREKVDKFKITINGAPDLTLEQKQNFLKFLGKINYSDGAK